MTQEDPIYNIDATMAHHLKACGEKIKDLQSTHSKDIGELLEALIKNNHTLNALKCFSESKNHTEGHYAALRMIVDNEFLIQKHGSK